MKSVSAPVRPKMSKQSDDNSAREMHFGVKQAVLFAEGTLILGSPLYWYMSRTLEHFGVDWNIAFYPATVLLLHGQNPYQVPYLHNPVWALIPLIPFALFGMDFGRLLLFYFNLFSLSYIAYRIAPKRLAFLAFLLSPLLYYYLFLGNIDSFVLWGIFVPLPAGLFLLSAKPQVGIGIMVYKVYTIWRDQGFRPLIVAFPPVIAALGVSFLLFGQWFVDKSDHLVSSAYWNVSLFPWSLPFGMFLIVAAIRRRRQLLSIPASALISPYLSWGTWQIALLGLLDNNLAMFGFVAALWLLFIMQHFLL